MANLVATRSVRAGCGVTTRSLPFERIGTELVRAVRGRRSQLPLSRRLGFSTNVVYSWEAGRREPNASTFFAFAGACRVDVRQALRRFFATPPAWLPRADLGQREGVMDLLLELRGSLAVVDVARRMGKSRFAVARLCNGEAEPKLSTLLAFVEATTGRSLDFVAAFFDPAKLPSAADAWETLSVKRRAVYNEPHLAAVLLALDLEPYRALVVHQHGWIARRLGIARTDEERCLALLEELGQVRREGMRLVVRPVDTLDTRADAEAERALKAHWTSVGLERLRRGLEGQYSFNVFTVSQSDLNRLRELHLSYFRQLRAIVSESQPADHLVVANVQLFELAEP